VGNYCFIRSGRATAQRASSSSDQASQSDDVISHASSIASEQNSPRAEVMSQVRQNWLNANMVAIDQLSASGQPDGSSFARQAALVHVSKFHQVQLFGKINAACVDENTADTLNDFGQVNVLQRKVSFLSIAPQLEDIDVLTRVECGQQPRRIDTETRTVLEEVLKTVRLNHRIVEADAVGAAREGSRGLPLTVDGANFSNFLKDREALLAGVVDACRLSQGRSAQLQPLLHRLATDYFAVSARLPGRLEPGSRRIFEEVSVDAEPLTVLVGEFEESSGQHLVDPASSRDKILLAIGTPVVTGPLDALTAVLKGFEDRAAPEQRAAAVLQTLFYIMTHVEEKIVGVGLNCRNEYEERQSRGTAMEIGYTGSRHAGDACDISRGGVTQRERASALLRTLPETLRAHQAAHQTPLLADANLAAWVLDPCFQTDVFSMTTPMLRLPNAQLSTTAALLAHMRAFGGNGIVSQ
jgi:hypothetical protein